MDAKHLIRFQRKTSVSNQPSQASCEQGLKSGARERSSTGHTTWASDNLIRLFSNDVVTNHPESGLSKTVMNDSHKWHREKLQLNQLAKL